MFPTADDLRRQVEDCLEGHSSRDGHQHWWRKPLLVTAKADERFDMLLKIVSSDHLLPRQLLPGARSVVVYFLPFKRELASGNRQGNMATREWGHAYVDTNNAIVRINADLSDTLSKSGYKSTVTPPTHNFDETRLISRWSHKHLAVLCGLGRLGLHTQVITPEGCCGRLGSFVTEADLGDSPLVEGESELCLHKQGKACRVCVKRCIFGALTEDGFNRFLCYEQLNRNDTAMNDLPLTNVCGKCVAVTPCSLKAPGGQGGHSAQTDRKRLVER